MTEVTELGIPVYECIKCGTKTSSEELLLLPEIKCICGYRILKKTRPPTVKTIKAI
jgi:DNA-directed RNA polymerase subunit P